MYRPVAAVCEVDGVAMRAGDRIALVYPSANRDEAVFDEPFEVDLARAPNPHVAFGFGQNFCLGAHVARQTMRVALDQLTTRFTNLRRVGPSAHHTNDFVNALRHFGLHAHTRSDLPPPP